MDKHEKNIEAAYKKLKDLLATTDAKDILVRYEVGRTVVALKDESMYGAEGIEKVAARLGRGYGQSTLYRYLDVAEAWSEGAIKRLAERRNAEGFALCWSHLELIAEADEVDRDRLIELTLADSLSVRELRAIMKEKLAADESPGRHPGSEAADPFLGREVIPFIAEYIVELEAEMRTWEERLLADVGVDARELTGEEAALLRATLERMVNVGMAMKSLACKVDHLLAITRPTARRPLLLPPAAVVPA